MKLHAASFLAVFLASTAANAQAPVHVVDFAVGAEPLFMGRAGAALAIGFQYSKPLTQSQWVATGSNVVSIDPAGTAKPLFAQDLPVSSAQCLGCYPAMGELSTWGAFLVGNENDDGSWDHGVVYGTDGTVAGTVALGAPAAAWIPFGNQLLSGNALYSLQATSGTTLPALTIPGAIRLVCGTHIYALEGKTDAAHLGASYALLHDLDATGADLGVMLAGARIRYDVPRATRSGAAFVAGNSRNSPMSCLGGELFLWTFDHFVERDGGSPGTSEAGHQNWHVPGGAPPVVLPAFVAATTTSKLFTVAQSQAAGAWTTSLKTVTPQGTTNVHDWSGSPSGWGSPSIEPVISVGDRFYFSVTGAASAADYGFWVTDGTAANTIRLNELAAYHSVAIGDHLFFDRMSAANVRELWQTDGTALGTKQIPLPAEPALVSYWYSTAADGLRVVGSRVYLLRTLKDRQVSLWMIDTAPPPAGSTADAGPSSLDGGVMSGNELAPDAALDGATTSSGGAGPTAPGVPPTAAEGKSAAPNNESATSGCACGTPGSTTRAPPLVALVACLAVVRRRRPKSQSTPTAE